MAKQAIIFGINLAVVFLPSVLGPAAFAAVEADPAVRAVVLTGRHGAFCTGDDLAESLTRDVPAQTAAILHFLAMCDRVASTRVPVIAAVDGWCIGGGTALDVACDWRVAAHNSAVYVPEIRLGMNMSWQSVPRFTHLIGPAKTKQLLILAEPLDAATAERWGLLDYLCAPGEALSRARELAAKVASMPPVPVRMAKKAINASANALDNAVSFMEADQFLLAQGTEDALEGMTAFLTKRPPKFTGN